MSSLQSVYSVFQPKTFHPWWTLQIFSLITCLTICLYAGGCNHPLIFPYLKTPVPIFWIPPQDPPTPTWGPPFSGPGAVLDFYITGKPNFSLQFKSPSDPFSHFMIGGPFLMVFKVILEYEWMSSSASHSFTGPPAPYSGDTFWALEYPNHFLSLELDAWVGTKKC